MDCMYFNIERIYEIKMYFKIKFCNSIIIAKFMIISSTLPNSFIEYKLSVQTVETMY